VNDFGSELLDSPAFAAWKPTFRRLDAAAPRHSSERRLRVKPDDETPRIHKARRQDAKYGLRDKITSNKSSWSSSSSRTLAGMAAANQQVLVAIIGRPDCGFL
jgi:hypothetical protein